MLTSVITAKVPGSTINTANFSSTRIVLCNNVGQLQLDVRVPTKALGQKMGIRCENIDGHRHKFDGKTCIS
jgi:hypothetical protein